MRAIRGYSTATSPGGHRFLTPIPNRGFTGECARSRLGEHDVHLHPAGLTQSCGRMELPSHRIIGWSMKPTLARELVLDSLHRHRAISRCVLVKSDRGTQYGSEDWTRFCHADGLDSSMSRRGNRWDNAVAKSFFDSLKKARIRKRIYKTRELARADIRIQRRLIQSNPPPQLSWRRQPRGVRSTAPGLSNVPWGVHRQASEPRPGDAFPRRRLNPESSLRGRLTSSLRVGTYASGTYATQ